MWAAASDGGVLLFGGYTDNFRAEILAVRDGAVFRIGDLPEAVADAGFFQIGPNWYTAGGETGQHIRGAHTWSGEIFFGPGKHE